MLFTEELNTRSRRVLLDDVLADLSGAEVFRLAQGGTLHEALGIRCELILEGVDDEALLMLDDRDRAALANHVRAVAG